MSIVMIDTWVQNDCTLGRLTCGDFRCFTLELPWRDNTRGKSCIPAGHYNASMYDSPTPGRGRVPMLENVPGRSFIQIHSGNYTSQIEGCILVGDGIQYLNNDDIPDVVNSRNTLKALLSLLPDTFELAVMGEGRAL